MKLWYFLEVVHPLGTKAYQTGFLNLLFRLIPSFILATEGNAIALEGQRCLSSLRITHLVHLHIISQIHILHTLRRDEDELFSNRTSRSLNHHRHTRSPVHAVHEDVEFVKAANRGADGLPDTQEETYRRK